MVQRILLLGGTTEARLLAGRLTDCAVTLSLAGRTAHPLAMPVPVRVGGFGGVAGLAAWLCAELIDVLVDATHPYAARISANAVEATRITGVPLVALRRPGWRAGPGDDWRDVPDLAAALAALGVAPRRVFLALGRQEVAGIVAAPQHAYLIRSVDPILPAIPGATCITARGPFDVADEAALLRAHRIEAIICKNSGGAASEGKLIAARMLGLPVLMLARPVLPDTPGCETVEAALAHLRRLRGV